jgi:DNA-binding NarL/FixJ family response regulator
MKKRVMIVDEQLASRQLLAFRLASDYEIVDETDDGQLAIDACKLYKPDVVILELALSRLCGKEVLRRVRIEVPNVRVLVYTGTQSQKMILDCLRFFPHGFVHKRDSLSTLLEALRAIATGKSYFSTCASPFLPDMFAGSSLDLTTREVEILQLVAESYSSKEIAARLRLSPKTVENHRAHIMEKLRIHDTAALTLYAVRNGLVT